MIHTTEEVLEMYLTGKCELYSVLEIQKDNKCSDKVLSELVSNKECDWIVSKINNEHSPILINRIEEIKKHLNFNKEPQQEAPELPKELNTDKARGLIAKAVEAGYITVEAGQYKWNGEKVLLAYFAIKASTYLELKMKCGTYARWKPFEELFAASNLRNARGNWVDKTGYGSDFQPTGCEGIDTLFKADTEGQK